MRYTEALQLSDQIFQLDSGRSCLQMHVHFCNDCFWNDQEFVCMSITHWTVMVLRSVDKLELFGPKYGLWLAAASVMPYTAFCCVMQLVSRASAMACCVPLCPCLEQLCAQPQAKDMLYSNLLSIIGISTDSGNAKPGQKHSRQQCFCRLKVEILPKTLRPDCRILMEFIFHLQTMLLHRTKLFVAPS